MNEVWRDSFIAHNWLLHWSKCNFSLRSYDNASKHRNGGIHGSFSGKKSGNLPTFQCCILLCQSKGEEKRKARWLECEIHIAVQTKFCTFSFFSTLSTTTGQILTGVSLRLIVLAFFTVGNSIEKKNCSIQCNWKSLLFPGSRGWPSRINRRSSS